MVSPLRKIGETGREAGLKKEKSSLVLGMLIWKVPIPSPSAESERELEI